MEQINRYVDKFLNTQLVFISDQEHADLLEVFQEYEMFLRENVILLRDTNFQFERWFDASSYPTLFVYNQDKELVERIDNPIDIKSLIKITRFAYYHS